MALVALDVEVPCAVLTQLDGKVMHRLILAASPIAAEVGSAAAGTPGWALIAVPIITGAFALAAYVLKDWLSARHYGREASDVKQLVRTLHRDVEDAREQRDDIARQRDDLKHQLDAAIAELRLQRRED